MNAICECCDRTVTGDAVVDEDGLLFCDEVCHREWELWQNFNAQERALDSRMDWDLNSQERVHDDLG